MESGSAHNVRLKLQAFYGLISLFILWGLFIPCGAAAQSDVEALKTQYELTPRAGLASRAKLLDKIVSEYLYISIDSASKYWDILDTVVDQLADPEMDAKVYDLQGQLLKLEGNLEAAAEAYEEAVVAYLVLEKGEKAIVPLINIASCMEGLGRLDEAIAALIKSQEILRTNPNQESEAIIFAKRASVNQRKGDLEGALADAESAYSLAIDLEDMNVGYRHYVFNMFAGILMYHKRYEDAKPIFRLLVKENFELNRKANGLAIAFNLVNIHNLLSETDSAGLVLGMIQRDSRLLALGQRTHLHDLLATFHAKSGRFDSAYHHSLQSVKGYEQLGIRGNLVPYWNLAENAHLSGRKAEAVEHFYTYLDMKDSLLQIQGQDLIAEMETKYRLSEKQLDIANAENELYRSRLRQASFGASGLFLLAVLVLGYRYVRQKNQKLHFVERNQIDQIGELKKQVSGIVRMTYGKGLSPGQLDDVEEGLSAAIESRNNEEMARARDLLTKREQTKPNGKSMYDLELMQLLHKDFLLKVSQTYDRLTKADLKVVSFLLLNPTNKELAEALGLSLKAAEAARRRIRERMSLDSQVDLNKFILGLKSEREMVA